MNIFKDIKPCPFCSSKVEVHYASYYSNGVFGNFVAHCPRCGDVGLLTLPPIDDGCNPELDAYFDVWQHRANEDDDDLK